MSEQTGVIICYIARFSVQGFCPRSQILINLGPTPYNAERFQEFGF